jgi:hypothetical protein
MQAMRANIGKGLAAGMIGGLIAAWVMERFQEVIPKIGRRAEDAAPAFGHALDWPQRGGFQLAGEHEPANVKAAVLVSVKVFGHELQPSEKAAAGEAMHYAVGALAGAAYGVLAEFMPAARYGAGAAFGAALWAVSDELSVPLAGLAGPPQDYSMRVHGSALAAHMVYGVSTELVRFTLRSGMLAR